MTHVLIAILLGAILTAPVSAAPGDPRLVQGTLEWPATLTREPVIVVRGDDGQVYLCEVTEPVRQRADGLRAGGRIAILGLEATRSHELTTIAVGAGDTAALALALSQAAATSATSGGTATPPTPAPAATTATLPSSVSIMPPPLASTPPPSAAPTVVIMASGPHATTSTPGGAPVPTIVPTTVAKAPASAPTPRRIAPATTPATSGRGQWSRLDGMVEAVAGSMLTLKMDDGAVAYVDISQLSPSVAQVLRQGTGVSVYGYPLEHRFEAAGYIQTNPAAPELRAPARTSR
jgi:hypothetical protein